MTIPSGIRCAIYTHKSSEGGLERSFNSLDAQREACEANIVSQRHEGWPTLPGRRLGYFRAGSDRCDHVSLIERIIAAFRNETASSARLVEVYALVSNISLGREDCVRYAQIVG
jgi:hypothetical protein